MHEIPHAPLSDALEERIGGRRIVSAVFLTFKFDPSFFEQEVLPVLFDVPLSHVTAIRLIQLEDTLRMLHGEIAVYYDVKGLVATGTESAKLDVRRIPIQHRTGIFHPKNIFLLLESEEPNEDGSRERTLCVTCLSANLTRAGWWENVEVCHFEEIREGDKTLLKRDIIDFLDGIKRRALAADRDQRAISEVLEFLRRNTDQRAYRSTADGLHTRFYNGNQPFADFLDAAAGDRLYGANLEVISPYFDDEDESLPLNALIERFEPKEVRVLLPRGQSGEALCNELIFKSVREHPRVTWAKLPTERTSSGKGKDLAPRFVHAKVYRFFSSSPTKELLFVGSVNLTSPAHLRGGNLESGFLVDATSRRRPDFWLEPDSQKPNSFEARPEADEVSDMMPVPVAVRYSWGTKSAEAFWLNSDSSPKMRFESREKVIGELDGLPARTWVRLSEKISERLGEALGETSFVKVTLANADPAIILVQEEDMAQKPSLLLQLSVTDILRYWAMLSQAQRTAFLELKWTYGQNGDGADLVTRLKFNEAKDTLFDRFAGFFHAFGSLEKSVAQALAKQQTKDASYRLFGRKYDSLSTLLGHLPNPESGDDVDRYVIAMCATQLVREIKTAFPEFWSKNMEEGKALSQQIADLTKTIRDTLLTRAPDDMIEFLSWFDRWFLERAHPLQVQRD